MTSSLKALGSIKDVWVQVQQFGYLSPNCREVTRLRIVLRMAPLSIIIIIIIIIIISWQENFGTLSEPMTTNYSGDM